ncbi:MAG: isoprenyl transferase [Verrucomicrobiota bacterium]
MADAANPIPEHIAIIMDGNGRWANEQGLPRKEGHKAGAESVDATLKACGDLGVRYLTLYAFSSENWKRPKDEIDALMSLLVHFLKEKTRTMMENNIRLNVIGQIDKLPFASRTALKSTVELTKNNNSLDLIVALSYGSREEIVAATQSLMKKAKSGEIDPKDLDEETFSQHLFTANFPDPELLIRTSGELRLSNFLLWQISYSEIYITDTYWPEFRRPHLEKAIEHYQNRHRRFGGLTP